MPNVLYSETNKNGGIAKAEKITIHTFTQMPSICNLQRFWDGPLESFDQDCQDGDHFSS